MEIEVVGGVITLRGGGCAGMTSVVHADIAVGNGRVIVVFDMGSLSVPEHVTRTNHLTVLITHLHADHCSGINGMIAARSFQGLHTHLCVPWDIEVTLLDRLIQTQLSMHASGVKTENDARQYHYTVTQASDGESIPLKGGRRIVPFRTFHRVPSCGYAVVSTTKHLLPEYQGLPGKEIGRLKKELGESALFRVEETVELAYTGDTTIAFLTHPANAFLRQARVLITECTYLDSENPPEQAIERGHIHLADLSSGEASEALSEIGTIVLTHFSKKYSQDYIQRVVPQGVHQSIRDKCRLLILDQYHN